MKIKYRIVSLPCAVAGALLFSSMASAQVNVNDPDSTFVSDDKVDEKALDALHQMSLFLRNLKKFELTSDAYLNLDAQSGEIIQLHTVAKYKVIMPNNMVVTTQNSLTNEVDLYDGKNLYMLLPNKKVYAELPYEGSIGSLLEAVHEEYGVDFPVQHLFRWGTDSSWLSNPLQARVIGEDVTDGWPTIQYAVRLEGLDFQIWLDNGPYPVPRRIVVSDRTNATNGEQRYAANLIWNVAPHLNADDFAIEKVAGGSMNNYRKVTMEKAAALSSE